MRRSSGLSTLASPSVPARVVLVGGGHAHVQLLERWIRDPLPGALVTLVVDRTVAVYSGMVPGFVAGDYEVRDLSIDLAPLARRAGVELIVAPAIGLDPDGKRILLRGREPLGYDLASLNVGSAVRGLELPGVAGHALPTRPIGVFVDEVRSRLDAARRRRAEKPVRLVVVGAGSGGVELAFVSRARLVAAGAPPPAVTVVDSGDGPLRGYPVGLIRRVRRHASAAGIVFRTGAKVAGVEPDGLLLQGGERLESDLVLWATGAAPNGFTRDVPLRKDPNGFLLVRDTLEVEGYDGLLAVGDCAVPASAPWVPRAGVYSVREGPVAERNLRARLACRPLESYRPQRDFLSLLNIGHGRAVGCKWGLSFEGRWTFRWKDRLDRSFVERFRPAA